MNIPNITQFYEDLILLYSQIQLLPRYKEIGKIDSHISWYLADSNDYIVTAKQKKNTYILDVDIKSAFTTICNNLFSKDSEFVQEMNQIEDKKARNIFIATNLKGEHLKILNRICKIIIFGITFDTTNDQDKEDISILELKKDGILITCNENTFKRLQSLNDFGENYTKILINKGFQFHTTLYQKYVRSNRTSLFLADETIQIKGNYKYFPKQTKQIVQQVLLERHSNLMKLNKMYSEEVWNIVKQSSLRETLENYYVCENGKIVNRDGKYEKISINTKIDPRLYLKLFVYPSILVNKIN